MKEERVIPMYIVPDSNRDIFIKANFITFIKDFIESANYLLDNNLEDITCAELLVEGTNDRYFLNINRIDMYVILNNESFIRKMENQDEYELCAEFLKIKERIDKV